MKRRLITLIALLVLLLPVIAACGGGDATATTGSTEPTAATGGTTTEPAVTPSEAASTDTPPTAAATDTAPATSEPTAMGNVLSVHQIGYPDIFDPQKSSFSSEIVILSQIYEGLTRLDENLDSVPGAAETWEYNADATQITFTLRPDLKYSDGSPLTAANFVYAIDRTCDPVTAGQYQSILFDVAGCSDYASTPLTDTAKIEAMHTALMDNVQAVDDTTLTVKLAQPAPYFHTVAGLWVLYPVKQELVEAGGDNWWQKAENHIGNGPFVLDSIAENQQLEFSRNENYWNPTKLDGMKYLYIADSAVALEAFKQGQIDIMTVDPSQLPAVTGDAALNADFVQYPAATTTVLDFNLTKAPFEDLKVREAFAYAFDRESYCEVIRNGDCLPTLTWIPKGIPGFDEAEDRFAFDPEKAKEALAASTYGSADKLPEITLAYNSNDPANKVRHEFIAQNYKDVLGVNILLEPQPSQEFSAARKNVDTRRQLNLGGWIGDYPDPQNWLSVYWRSDAFAKRQGYGNPDADALMTTGDTTLDQAARLTAYQEAQKMVVGDLPSVMLYNPTHIFLVSPAVKGAAQTAADDQFPGQWVSTTIELSR